MTWRKRRMRPRCGVSCLPCTCSSRLTAPDARTAASTRSGFHPTRGEQDEVRRHLRPACGRVKISGMNQETLRLNLMLPPGYAEKLSRIAARAQVAEGALASTLLAQ